MVRVIPDYVSPDKARELYQSLTTIDDAYFIDRHIHKPNLGIDGSIGYYFSCSDVSCPAPLQQQIISLIPTHKEMMCEEWVINKTHIGGYMPPHIDNEGYFGFAVLALNTGAGVFTYYENNDINRPIHIKDKAGQLIWVEDIAQLHAVSHVTDLRFTLIFLYL